MKLRGVGFFRELRHGSPDGPSLRDAMRASPDANASRIQEYLSNGVLLVASPGIVPDVVDPAHPMIGAPHILTDGVWAWPADLPYYLGRYHVRLPDAFLQHMSDSGWSAPGEETVDVSRLELEI